MNVLYRSIASAVGVAIAIHAFTVGVLCDVLPREATPPLFQTTKTLRFPEGNFLRLAQTDGSVEVLTHGGRDFLLHAEIRAYGSASLLSATEAYVDTMVQGSTDGSGIRIQTECGERPEPIDLRIDYRLTVPKGTNLSVEGANGNVLIREGCGAIFITGNNTDIKVIRPGGAVRAESTNGRIKVEHALGETVLKTINGSIYATMNGGYLEANTTNGNVSVALLDNSVTSCDLTSLNGGITLSVTDSAIVSLDAVTESGVVRSELELHYAEGYPKRRAVSGTSGDGGTSVSLHSKNGDINIVRSKT